MTIIGVILVPVLWLGLLLLWLALLTVPFGAFFYGCIGMVQALRGRLFRYPYIGKLGR
jgi:uncharacterized membrane protein